jgi:hypothetical protein
MRATRSRTTSLLVAVMDCQAGQVVIDGQCSVPQVNTNNAPVDHPNVTGPVMGDSGHWR